MKHKFLFLLMLLGISLYPAKSWAQLERPAMPVATLESDKSYYLYNVEADLFATKISNSYVVNEVPSAFTITLLDNGAYTVKDSNGKYLYAWGSGRLSSGTALNAYTWWSIASSEDSYLIQCSELNREYNSEQYLGWTGESGTAIQYNLPITGAVHWKLVPADASGDRYAAALRLYKEIIRANENGLDGATIDYYTNLYASRATADIDEINNAAYELRRGIGMSGGYIAPYWNEAPIYWTCSEGTFGNSYTTWYLPDNNQTSGTYFKRRLENGESSTLSATVIVSEPSAFVYSLEGYDGNIKVYVDDQMVRELKNKQISQHSINGIGSRFIDNIPSGKHTIKWVVSSNKNGYNYFTVKMAGVMSSCPLISVSLLEPGSLGTEVLYNTDHIKNVRSLKIKGAMNSDDWSKIKMMHYLQELDLSEAIITDVPQEQFSLAADTSSYFLHKLVLPEGLQTINERAFYASLIDNLGIPSTVTKLGEKAFVYSHIQELDLPDNLADIAPGSGSGSSYGVFTYMYWLKRVKLPKNLTKIPNRTFEGCHWLTDVVLPEALKTIDDMAFYGCNSIKISSFPENLTYIGSEAFYYCYNALATPLNENLQFIGSKAFYKNSGAKVRSVVIPNSVTSIDSEAFRGCSNLEDMTLPTPVWKYSNNILSECSSLKTLRLNCPTVARYNTDSYYYPVDASHIAEVDLYVPNISVTSYKLDSYWYNFKSINGFSTEEIQDWVISNPLVLNRERFAGEPNITIQGSYYNLPSLKINGDDQQNIKNLHMRSASYDYNSYAGQILSKCNNVVINGTASVDLTTESKRWHFFSLPYDVKVSDITSLNAAAQKAVRYYDGANRAQMGATGSWKNFADDAVIPAGTGFIVQTNMFVANRFPSFNETKQNMVANTEFVKTLEVNDSETPANRGWNLVGNPWQCFFNNHYLNFTGPITVWDTYNRTYKAYSLIDDDYAIRPNEAFFVQCPDGEHNTIGFPVGGRQLTAEIVSQNPSQVAMRSGSAQGDERRLVDIIISDGNQNDQTRIVLNEGASVLYEPSCDASKMMSMDVDVPQIYTIGDDETQYSINERPVGEGCISVGFFSGKSGEYTFKLSRSAVDAVILIDRLTGEETDLARGEYTFTSEAGTYNSRFSLRFNPGETTGIEMVKSETVDGEMYNICGQRISKPAKGITIQNGKKLIIK